MTYLNDLCLYNLSTVCHIQAVLQLHSRILGRAEHAARGPLLVNVNISDCSCGRSMICQPTGRLMMSSYLSADEEMMSDD